MTPRPSEKSTARAGDFCDTPRAMAKRDENRVVPLPLDEKVASISGVRVGTLVGRRPDNALLVDFPGNPGGPREARSTIAFEREPSSSCEVLLVFEEEDPRRPIIMGVMQPPPGHPSADVELDGERLVLSAEREIILRCGEAELVLRRNGRVVLRGAYVETRSKGVNRIKGGSVQIN